MDRLPPPPPEFFMPLLDLSTLQVLVTLTFLIQAVLIGLQGRMIQRYAGMRTFLVSTLILAGGSALTVVQRWVPEGWTGLVSSLLLLWGSVLQFSALRRFTGEGIGRWHLWLAAGASVAFFVLMGLAQTLPFVPIRETFLLPFLVGAVLTLASARVKAYRLGAMITMLPLLGYAVESLYRIVQGVIDPTQMHPGPNLSNIVEAGLYFVFGLLWTTGFQIMVNQRLQSELSALATLDALTGQPNRRAMTAALETAHDRFTRYSRPYSVILLDVDHFKRINDTQGHHSGDEVLVTLSRLLSQALRAGDVLARWGGEEFLILLPETETPAAGALAERLRALTAAHPWASAVTFSAGVAGACLDETVEQVLKRADEALYRAKVDRNRVVTDAGPSHQPL